MSTEEYIVQHNTNGSIIPNLRNKMNYLLGTKNFYEAANVNRVDKDFRPSSAETVATSSAGQHPNSLPESG